MANKVATGAGKAFAYGTGAGGRSHLAKLRDGARHCNSALSLPFLLRFSLGRQRHHFDKSQKLRPKESNLLLTLCECF